MGSPHFLALLLCFFCFLPHRYVSSFLLGFTQNNDRQVWMLKLNRYRRESSFEFDPTRVTQLSWHPRAFIYKGFLTDNECDHLINLAKDKLEKSYVADSVTGKRIVSEVRTSSGMFLDKAQDEIVANIEARIAAWTFLPEENGESIQVLRYENGQKYEPHFDYFQDKVSQQFGGHRFATVLMYLSNVENGGETVFPDAEGSMSQVKDGSWSDCAKMGYAVKPRKGDALLFFSLHLNATTDTRSLHGSCPVLEGEKWSATKWIHVTDYTKIVKLLGREGCVDENEYCAKWAKAGECEKNPKYMVELKDPWDSAGRVVMFASLRQAPSII